MDVRVVEAWNDATSCRVDDQRVAAVPPLDVLRAGDFDDSFADHRDRVRGRLARFAGPDAAVSDDEIGCDGRPRTTRGEPYERDAQNDRTGRFHKATRATTPARRSPARDA